MPEEEKKKSSVWTWVAVVAVIVVLAAVSIWYFTKDTEEESTDTATEQQDEESAVVIPDGWLGFTSAKYGFSLSYPSEYTIAESAVGTLKFTQNGTEMIDMYVFAANGDEEGMMTSQENLYTDDTKGYMIMDSVVQSKVAGVTAKSIYGSFGKNAGVSQTHEGARGIATFFAKNDKLFIFDSYDNGDETAVKNFTDFLGTISF